MIIAVLHPRNNACREKFPDAIVKCWGKLTFDNNKDTKTRYPSKFLLDVKKLNPDYILVDVHGHSNLFEIVKAEFPHKVVVRNISEIPVQLPPIEDEPEVVEPEPEPEPEVVEPEPEPEPEPEVVEEVMDPEEMFSG